MFETSLCQILFYVLAALAILCSIGVVAYRNPVNSAMCMAVCFAMIAAIYFGMGAQFLGIVQLIVYAGAILVLFLFVVMMLDIHDENHTSKTGWHAVVGVLVAGCAAGIIFKAAIKDVEADGHLILTDEGGMDRRYAFKEVKFIIK